MAHCSFFPSSWRLLILGMQHSDEYFTISIIIFTFIAAVGLRNAAFPIVFKAN